MQRNRPDVVRVRQWARVQQMPSFVSIDSCRLSMARLRCGRAASVESYTSIVEMGRSIISELDGADGSSDRRYTELGGVMRDEYPLLLSRLAIRKCRMSKRVAMASFRGCDS